MNRKFEDSELKLLIDGVLSSRYEPSMIEEVYNLKLPVNACSIDDFRDIAEMMLDGTMDESSRQAYINKLSTKLVEIGISKH